MTNQNIIRPENATSPVASIRFEYKIGVKKIDSENNKKSEKNKPEKLFKIYFLII
jgi:hypothetical protein